ncbi:MAG: hypothetical protein Q8R28_21785 [Dehalococcoidia bacterium]|nr:hypothetical protein [Dehalococcoidia bacterium]
MATLASAQEKYARKTGPGSSAVQNYNAAKGRMTQNWTRGMSEFLGGAPAASVTQSYQAGIAAANYRGGDPGKWAANLRAKMMGG